MKIRRKKQKINKFNFVSEAILLLGSFSIFAKYFKTGPMEKNVLSFGTPKELEAKRIAEIKSLSYLERLERLMIIIEVSYTLRTVNRTQFQKINFLKTLNFHF